MRTELVINGGRIGVFLDAFGLRLIHLVVQSMLQHLFEQVHQLFDDQRGQTSLHLLTDVDVDSLELLERIEDNL